MQNNSSRLKSWAVVCSRQKAAFEIGTLDTNDTNYRTLSAKIIPLCSYTSWKGM